MDMQMSKVALRAGEKARQKTGNEQKWRWTGLKISLSLSLWEGVTVLERDWIIKITKVAEIAGPAFTVQYPT
jgi:hypothetical protein